MEALVKIAALKLAADPPTIRDASAWVALGDAQLGSHLGTGAGGTNGKGHTHKGAQHEACGSQLCVPGGQIAIALQNCAARGPSVRPPRCWPMPEEVFLLLAEFARF